LGLKKIKIGQRKFELDWEQIGDICEGFFFLKYTMATSYCIFILRYLEINSKYSVYEHLCKVWLNFAILFEKNAIFRKGTSALFEVKLSLIGSILKSV
jgi:hypothetical protein